MKPPCLCSALPIKSDLWVGYKLGQRSFFCQLGVKCQNDDGQKFLESFHRSDPVSGSTADVTGEGVFLNQKTKPKKRETAASPSPCCKRTQYAATLTRRKETKLIPFFLAEDKRAEWRSGYRHVTPRNPRASPPLIKHYNGRSSCRHTGHFPEGRHSKSPQWHDN